MSATGADAQALPHPSPHRHRVGFAALAFGLCGGPLAWAVQFNVNYALASQPCFPSFLPRTGVPAHWAGTDATMLIVNVAALLVALAAAAVSWRTWRATQGEHQGGASHLLQSGEGRSRFLGICGLLAGIGFFAASVFNTITLLELPPCAG
jgi:hypothetical protein